MHSEIKKISTKVDILQLNHCEIRSKIDAFHATATEINRRLNDLEVTAEGPSFRRTTNGDSNNADAQPKPALRTRAQNISFCDKTTKASFHASSEDLADCKRLKERLKNAMKAEVQYTAMADKVAWNELIFGICAPDARKGKEGSRHALCPHLPSPESRHPFNKNTCSIQHSAEQPMSAWTGSG